MLGPWAAATQVCVATWAVTAAAASPVHLRIEAPAADAQLRSGLPLVEIRGRATGAPLPAVASGSDASPAAGLSGSDVVLLLDVSNSTLRASGFDVDANGRIGQDQAWVDCSTRRAGPRCRKWRQPADSWTTDPADSIVRGELLTARSLLAPLEALDNQLGLLTFASRPVTRASLGAPPSSIEGALDGLELKVDPGGSALALALDAGRRVLTGHEGSERAATVVLLSDAEPSRSGVERWRELAGVRRAARRMAREGLRVHVLGFGPAAHDDPWALPDVAELTGGSYLAVAHPWEALEDLGLGRAWHPRAVRITNLTSGQPARAKRLFDDGWFDGFLELVAGVNLIRVEVDTPTGPVQVDRRVHYSAVEEPGAAQHDAEQLLIDLLRRREHTEQTAARRRQLVLERRLEIQVDEAARTPPKVTP